MALQQDEEAPRVGVAEAKARFSELLGRVESGETIGITRHGKVVARLVPSGVDHRPSIRGMWADKEVWIADDFDELGPEWDEYVK